MKNKGFTLIELITTFALTSVIVILLINVIVVIKELYEGTNSKTELYINQNSISNTLNSRLRKGNLVYYEDCSYDSYNFCYDFTYDDGSSDRLTVTSTSISIGDIVYKFEGYTSVGYPTLTTSDVSTEIFSKIINIKIPIINKLYPDMDFGVNIVYQM